MTDAEREAMERFRESLATWKFRIAGTGTVTYAVDRRAAAALLIRRRRGWRPRPDGPGVDVGGARRPADPAARPSAPLPTSRPAAGPVDERRGEP